MQIVVDEGIAGLRVDAAVARAGAAPSVTAARRLVAAGRVRVDGRAAKKGVRVHAGQVIDVNEEPAGSPPTPSPEVPLVVLYEDADLVAINKPAGLASHPLSPHEAPTVAGAIVARFPECARASADPREGGLAHRLDRDTTGVLIAARSAEVWAALRAALGASDCEKLYLAEVHGHPRPAPSDPFVSPGPVPDSWVVLAPIGRVGRRGGRVRVGGGRHPQEARTEIRVRESRGGTTLVEARLCKGRAHQVRAHLAYLGAPVVGDATYGSDDGADLRLHAAAVSFKHPRTGHLLRIEAPPPAWVGGR